MENAIDALKMAFAVIVLVMALSVAMITFSNARQTSEAVLAASDETEYYDYQEYTKNGTVLENRIVGFETIIPTLYKYDKERYKIEFKQGSYNSETGEITNVKPYAIYQTTTNPDLWSNYQNDYESNVKSKSIYTFDIVEETQRKEPWVGSENQIKLHLDAIISGSRYLLPQYGDTNHFIDYSNVNYDNNTLARLRTANAKFIEQIGRITSVEDTTSVETGAKIKKTTTKVIITYILIN